MKGAAGLSRSLFEGSPSPLSVEQGERLDAYLELLLRWSKRINLTGFSDPAAAAEGLLYDAAYLAPLIDEGSGRALDVGAGAGGLAVALAVLRPELSLTLVEPRLKRAAFLRTARRELGLSGQLQIVEDRFEALRPDALASVEVAYAQAVMPPERWLPLARARLPEGASILCLTAAPLRALMTPLPEDLSVTGEALYRLPTSGAPRAVTRLSGRLLR